MASVGLSPIKTSNSPRIGGGGRNAGDDSKHKQPLTAQSQQGQKIATTGHHNNYSPSKSLSSSYPSATATSAVSASPSLPPVVRRPAPPPTMSPSQLTTSANGPNALLSPSGRGRLVTSNSDNTAQTNTDQGGYKIAAPAPTQNKSTAKPAPKKTARKPYRPPLSKKQLLLLKQINREEEIARLELETQQASDFTALGVSMQQSLMKLVNARVQSGGEMLARLQEDNAYQRAVNAEARAAHGDIMQTVSITSTVLKAFVEYHSSEEREYVRRLEIENGIMRRQLDAKDVELSRQFAEIEGLRGSLSRLIIRTDVENEAYRREVKAKIEGNTLGVEAMKKALQQRIDDTVLAIHKPQFSSKLKSLKELVEEEQFKVQQAADELRYLVDQIGAEDRFLPRSEMLRAQRDRDEKGTVPMLTNARDSGYYGVSAAMGALKNGENEENGNAIAINNGLTRRPEGDYSLSSAATMHSNFPRFYRDQLQSLNRHALLRILDVVSFEPRVVTAVGHALVSMGDERELGEDSAYGAGEKYDDGYEDYTYDDDDHADDAENINEEESEQIMASRGEPTGNDMPDAVVISSSSSSPAKKITDWVGRDEEVDENKRQWSELEKRLMFMANSKSNTTAGGISGSQPHVSSSSTKNVGEVEDLTIRRHLEHLAFVEAERARYEADRRTEEDLGYERAQGQNAREGRGADNNNNNNSNNNTTMVSNSGADPYEVDSIRDDDGGEDLFGLSENNSRAREPSAAGLATIDS